jgi:hypothetical protein
LIKPGLQISMIADRAGNTRNKARTVGLVSTRVKSFADRIGGSDANDYYRLRLDRASTLRLSLRGLKVDANIDLLNSTGQPLQRSVRKGNAPESIRQPLAAGVYLVRVFSTNRRTATSYRLSLVSSPLPLDSPSLNTPPVTETTSPPNNQIPTPNLPTSNNSFNIQFDYRFDTSGWFTPEKRAVLEAAANMWERIILDDFPDLPAGTITPGIINPQTRRIVDVVNDTPIDDVLIFVGARELGGMFGATLAVAAPALGAVNDPRYSGSNFEPAIASIAFDTSTNWFFDPTPGTSDDIPNRSYDFFSVALHEIAHGLGFGSSDAFNDQVSGFTFVGINARLQNNGNSLPLQNDRGHISESYRSGGLADPLMTPRYASGTRKLPTAVDVAVLNDIGYQVNYGAIPPSIMSSVQSDVQPSVAQSAQQRVQSSVQQSTRRSNSILRSQSNLEDMQRLYGYCGCVSCLMS